MSERARDSYRGGGERPLPVPLPRLPMTQATVLGCPYATVTDCFHSHSASTAGELADEIHSFLQTNLPAFALT